MQSNAEKVDYDSIARQVIIESLKKSGRICMQTMRTAHRRLDLKGKGSWFMVLHQVGSIIKKEGVEKFISQ